MMMVNQMADISKNGEPPIVNIFYHLFTGKGLNSLNRSGVRSMRTLLRTSGGQSFHNLLSHGACVEALLAGPW